MTPITGSVFRLGDNVDTDQIIPAIHLSYSLGDPEESRMYGRLALSGLPEASRTEPFVREGEDGTRFPIIIAGDNFGSGSSREHAPACLQIAGVRAVIARSFARIFYRNVIAGARFVPITAPTLDPSLFSTNDVVSVDVDRRRLTRVTDGLVVPLDPLGDAGDVLLAGGIFAYARQRGMVQTASSPART